MMVTSFPIYVCNSLAVMQTYLTDLVFINILYLSGSECLLTPERSIEIQNAIGADIIMQLDDVVSSTVSGPRVEEAMHRFGL